MMESFRGELLNSPSRTTLPLAGAQPGIWFAELSAPSEGGLYWVAQYATLRGDVSLAALSQAIRNGLAEADTIHARFNAEADPVEQSWPTVRNAADIPAPVIIDMTEHNDPEAAAHQHMQAALQNLPDITSATGEPPYSHILLRVGTQQVFWFQRYHHLCVDGYSIATLTRRILTLYRAAVEFRPAPGSPFIPFADVVAENRNYHQHPDAEQDRLWWSNTLETPYKTPSLSARHDTLPSPVSTNTRRADVYLSSTCTQALHGGRNTGVAETLIAALYIYMHRIALAQTGEAPTQAATIALGMPFMRRMGSCAIDSSGPMVSVFPVLLSLAADDTLTSVTQQLRTSLRQTRKHERYGSEEIQRDLKRVGKDTLLHRTLINMRAYDSDAQYSDLSVSTHPLITGPVEDLDINLTPDSREVGAFHIELVAHPELYSQDILNIHAERLSTFIARLVAFPDQPIAELALTGRDEEQKISAWSAGLATDVPPNTTTILDVLHSRMPHAAPAILSDVDGNITSDQLRTRIAQIGRWLISQNVGPGMIVAMALPRRIIAVETLFGILASGATLLPLDIAHPAERLHEMCTDAGASMLLTLKDSPEDLSSTSGPARCPILCLDDHKILQQITVQNSTWIADHERLRPLTPDADAYVLYTSGSTGRPKGVMVPHRGLLNLLLAHDTGIFGTVRERVGARRVRAGHAMSLAFDTSWEQLIWLALGHELHLFDEETRRDAHALVTQLAQHRIDTLDVSPAMMQQMIAAGLLEQPHRLAMIQLGGEAVPPALWSTLHTRTDTLFYNLYGPTEYSVDALCASISDIAEPVIGRPIANTHLQILDDRLCPVPIGIHGELYLSGPGLAAGYLGQPALTATRFVANPNRPGELMYRSGDRACWRPDGTVAFHGRGDRQFKIRGHRVELGEVERALATLPGVAGALVMAETANGTTCLLAWCVCQDATNPEQASCLTAALKQKLPSYMIPSGLAVLHAWPQTINGKIDRARLPSPRPQISAQQAGREPRTEAERLLCAHMAEALGNVPVGPEDDFFMMGGDSITAMSLGTALRRAGWVLRPRDIFSLRRADRMAGILVPVSGTDKNRLSAPDQEGPLGTLPIVAWFTERFGAECTFAHAVLMRVPPELTRAHVVTALNTLTHTHPALRLCASDTALTIPPHNPNLAESSVAEGNFCPANEDAPNESLIAETLARACKTLSPAAGKLLNIVLSPGSNAPGWMLVVIHHLAVDGVSWRVLLPQLKEACIAAIENRTPALVPEETSLRAWSLALPEEALRRRREIPLWQSILQTPAWSDSPLDPSRDRQDTAGHARLVMNPTLTAQLLNTLPTHCRASTESLLLTAVTQAMRSVFGATRLRVAMESHGRQLLTANDGTILDPDRTVGWLTAEYPVLIESPESTAIVALRNVKEALGQIPDRGIGYGLLRYTDPETSTMLKEAEEQAPCALLFNYLGRFQSGSENFMPQRLGKIFADSFAVHTNPASPLQHALELNSFVDEADGTSRLALSWSWASALYDRTTIQRLHDTALNWLQSLAASAMTHTLETADTLVPSECGVSAPSLNMLRTQYGPLHETLPLLPLHEGLLYHARLQSVGGRYTSVTRLFLNGPLDVTRLHNALDLVLRVHPPLRARFQDTFEGHAIQVIPARPEAWPLSGQNLEGLAPEEQEAMLESCEQQELALQFDPAQDLMVHARLVRFDAQTHALFLSAHHLVADGWSTPLIVQALAQAYGTDTLPDADTSYAQVVRALTARDPQPARTAWSTALTDAPQTLVFRDSQIAETVSEHEMLLDPTLEAALEARCRVLGLTRNTLMQGLWAATLSILTGQQDIVFGTPVSGRFSETDGLSSQIGLFSNTVPVRVTLRPDLPLLAQLTTLQDTQSTLLEHDGIGLAEIQRLAGKGALFDTLLVSENYPDDGSLEKQRFAGIQISAPRNRGYTHYPLTLMVLPGKQTRLILECRARDINGRPFNPEELLLRLSDLLSHMADPAATPWGQIDPRLEQERLMMDCANNTDIPIPDVTLHSLVHQQCTRTPNATALSDMNESLTYAEMQGRVRALAKHLYQAGARPGTIIGIALPRSVHLTLALLATLETGAAWLPLDTGYPDARLALMMDDAQPRIVLTDNTNHARFSAMMPAGAENQPQSQLLTLENTPPAHSTTSQITLPDVPSSPEMPAYLLYTSGSTGRPKGVLVSHRAIVNRLLWMQDTYSLTASDVVLQKTPSSFDVSIWEFFWPLISGASLFMAPPEAHRDPESLRTLIETRNVSTIHFVPSMLSAFLDHLQNAGHRSPCASLQRIFCSGEALDTVLARRCATWLTAPLHNLYGPTEAAVDVTYFPAVSVTDARSIPIGRPVWNTRLHILDAFLRPVPTGVPGELYLGGTQLADGYFGRPDLTALRFIPNPSGNGTRLYRTGDLACWMDDGTVTYLGRTDSQIKLRGQRIELAEIEHVLRELPSIAQACVSAQTLGNSRRTDLDTRQLIAHVMPAPDAQAPNPAALRSALMEKLPAHMVPAAIVPVTHWPTGPSGKLDRSALPLPHIPAAESAQPPQTLTENVIAECFRELLEQNVQSVDDDFFLLGGHSLLAMRLASLLRQKLGKPVSVGQIIAASTIKRLAHSLSSDATPDAEAAGMGDVLTLRTAGTAGMVFCIHPASGFAWQYTGLLSYLPDGFGLIGLQSPRPNGVIATCDTLSEACTRHLQTIRRIQPQGPYRIVGYSLGGTMAHAIAAALRNDGEIVDFLTLFDTYPPEGQDWSSPTQEEAEAEVERERVHFLEPGTAEDAEMVASREAMFTDIVANYADAVSLLSEAQTTPFDGNALLFAARIGMPDCWDPLTAWDGKVSSLSCHDIACAHEDILSPQSLATSGPILRRTLENLPRGENP